MIPILQTLDLTTFFIFGPMFFPNAPLLPALKFFLLDLFKSHMLQSKVCVSPMKRPALNWRVCGSYHVGSSYEVYALKMSVAHLQYSETVANLSHCCFTDLYISRRIMIRFCFTKVFFLFILLVPLKQSCISSYIAKLIH